MTKAAGLPADTVALAFGRAVGSPYAWYVVILLSAAHLVSFVDRFVMSLVLTPLKVEFGLTDTQLGLLHGTGFVILYTVAAVPLGWLADIANRRNIIMGGLIFWSIATAACGLSWSFGSLFAARVGVGLGEAALVPAAMSLIAAYVRREQIGRAVSIFTTGASLGKSFALIVGGAVLAALTLRGGMELPGFGHITPWAGVFVLAALMGVALALLFLTVKEPPRIATISKTSSLAAAFSHIGHYKLAYLSHTAAAACVIALVQGLAAWAPTFYARMFDMTPAGAGVLVGSVVLVAGPLGGLSSGWLVDRLQSRDVRGAPGLVMALSLASSIPIAFVFAFSRDFSLSVAAYGALSFCLTAGAPPGLAGTQIITPERLRGVVSALFLCVVTFFAVGFGPTLIGLVTDSVFGDPKLLNLSLLCVITCIGALGMIIAWISRTPTSRVAIEAFAPPADRRTASPE